MSSEIPPSIKSRPAYGTLSPVEANAHLLVADDAGGAVILEMAKQVPTGFWDNAEILYVNTNPGSEHDHSAQLEALGCPRLYQGPTIEAAQPRFRRSLERSKMGTQIYLTGSEQLLSIAMKTGMEAGLDYRGMQTQHRGSLARRVQCVHCKGVTSDVTTQPANCSHCGLLLLVRDHYSRRFAAFQGVNINAEDPTDIPEKEEVFL